MERDEAIRVLYLQVEGGLRTAERRILESAVAGHRPVKLKQAARSLLKLTVGVTSHEQTQRRRIRRAKAVLKAWVEPDIVY